MSAVERVFLGRQAPPVSSAASWIAEHPPSEGAETTVVVPSARGGRRLAVVLERSGARPTRIVTVGELAGILTPGCGVFSPVRLERQWLWSRALAEEGGRGFRGEAALRWRQARELLDLEDELSTVGLDLAGVLQLSGSLGEDFEEARFERLARCERRYRDLLEARGEAEALPVPVAVPRAADGGALVLLAVLELEPAIESLLAASGRPVHVLIPASSEEASGFDAWGRPIEAWWLRRRFALGEARLRVVDRYAEQAGVAVESLRSLGAGSPGARATLGLAAADLESELELALGLAEMPFHAAAGTRILSSEPCRLIAVAARFGTQRQFADLAALLRFPRMEAQLDQAVADLQGGGDAMPRGLPRALRRAIEARDWLSVLDLYSSASLVRRLDDELPGERIVANRVRELDRAALAMLELPGDGRRSLAEWSGCLLGFLERLYGDEAADGGAEDGADASRPEGLPLLRETLTEQADLAAAERDLSLSDAVEITLSRLEDARLPLARGEGGVEILGWLDLLLDDAPRVVVVGLNEGSVPEPLGGPRQLTQALRRRLGLRTSQSRFVRDLVILRSLVEGRRAVLVASRLDSNGEPLVPSRLLLRDGPTGLPRRVLQFYDENVATTAPVEDSPSRFALLAPDATVELPGSLPATAVGEYLRCPYRFYLRRVLGLEAVRDQPSELGPREFGSLAHDVLGAFARQPEARSEDPVAIDARLGSLLDAEARARLGAAPPVTARLQLEQLRRRLGRFSVWQAEQVREGWRIDPEWVEKSLTATFRVGGSRFEIRGRIDRLDRHPRHGARLIDYKTGEAGRSPDQVHFEGRPADRVWRDLQLPLYWEMLRQAGCREAVSIGFVNLPGDLQKDPLALAEWPREILEAGVARARQVIARVLERRFWPPGPAPDWVDDLAGLAGDRFARRAEMISAIDERTSGRGER